MEESRGSAPWRGACHVIAGPGGGRALFPSPEGKRDFLEFLGHCIERHGANLHVYCVMDDHYHLLLSGPGRHIGALMHTLNSLRATRLGERRQGQGLEGRFRCFPVESRGRLASLARCVHLEPCRAGLADRPGGYEWSSYRSYVGEAPCPPWLRTGWLLGRHGSTATAARDAFRVFSEDGLPQRARVTPSSCPPPPSP